MFTQIKQVQIIISLLKQFNISDIVISPGTRHVPLIHSVENDSFFHCYSIVDERSAGYFALGIAESLKRPVCVACTSATATCNYLPAIQEASEKHIPLIALTADRARYQRFNGESQCIDQVNMYKPYTIYSVDLPDVKDANDYWYANRCVNEALLELSHHEYGPIQINYIEPLSILWLSTFHAKEIPVTRKITRLFYDEINWSNYSDYLKQKKRILVLCGQCNNFDESLTISLKNFFNSFNAVVTYDYFSNIRDADFILSPVICDVIVNKKGIKKLKPDLIISYGSKVYSSFGTKFREMGIEHWYISEDGKVYDPFHSLTTIFAIQPKSFFEQISAQDGHNDKIFYSIWSDRYLKLNLSCSEYTNYGVIRKVLSHLPESTDIQVSVLNSMRIINFCDLPQDTIVFGNIGADGIDGALSTFLGQSSCTSKLSLLIIGDLSYLYDLNASLIKEIGNNVRILLINNFAGSEFHFNISKDRISSLDDFIAAGHHSIFNECALFSNMDYIRVQNKKELDEVVQKFFEPSFRPILLEVNTNADKDGKMLRSLLRNNTSLTIRNRVARCLKRILYK